MGYNTYFDGSISFNKPLPDGLVRYINKFSKVRHMNRDNEVIKKLYPNWMDLCPNGELGNNGEYFIGGNKMFDDESVLNHNKPASSQPGLWCQWIINENGELVWDENEKFYNYYEWLIYLIDNFIKPYGYVANGDINFQGEDRDDSGTLVVNNNVVSILY